MALGENGAFVSGAGGRCRWTLGRFSWSREEGVWSSGRSGWTAAASRRNESITFIPQRCWESNPFPLTGSQELGPRSSQDTWRHPHDPAPYPDCPRSKVTWPHPPPTHVSAGTFLANSIFASLGSSVEIKRLFAVTNVANSDQTI